MSNSQCCATTELTLPPLRVNLLAGLHLSVDSREAEV